MKPKSPLAKDGMLICPYCRGPLLVIENEKTGFEPACSLCKKPIGKLSVSTMKTMIDKFPSEVLKEWSIELKSMKENR